MKLKPATRFLRVGEQAIRLWAIRRRDLENGYLCLRLDQRDLLLPHGCPEVVPSFRTATISGLDGEKEDRDGQAKEFFCGV